VFSYPMVSPKEPTTLMMSYTYPLGHDRLMKAQKWFKNLVMAIFGIITSYATPNNVIWEINGIQLSYDITHGAQDRMELPYAL
jgi:hypothetical protein